MQEMNEYLDKADRDEEIEIEEEELHGKDYLLEKIEREEGIPGMYSLLTNR